MSRTTRRKISKAAFEVLEGRRMFASSGLGDGGVLTVVGAAGTRNNVAITANDAGTQLTVNVNGAAKQYAADQVNSIRVIGGEKDDVVTLDPRIEKPSFVRTGGGNDVVTTAAGNDIIVGGVGNDTIIAGSGNDLVFGGNGADIIIGNKGNDVLFGGAGSDRLDAGSGDDIVHQSGEPASRITRIDLIDADTDQVIRTFKNFGESATLDLKGMPTQNLNFKATLASPAGGSIGFHMTGANTTEHIENAAPYAMAGNDANDFRAWTPKVGKTKLSTTPYSSKNAAGAEGATKSVNLNIVDTTGQEAAPPPVEKPAAIPQPTPQPTPQATPVAGKTGGAVIEAVTPGVDNTGQAGAPVAVINVIDAAVNAGQTVHVDALTSTLSSGSVINTQYAWNFGDTGSPYNRLPGWNAAHNYAKPGNYTVTLYVTNSAGKTSHTQTTVNISAASRRQVFVSPSGNDGNSGGSVTTAVKSYSRAAQLVGSNSEILFERGGSWTVTSRLAISGTNVVVGAYGTGAKPKLTYSGALNYSSMISTSSGASDVTIRDITIDSANTTQSKTGYNDGISTGGSNISVIGCTFMNVGYAINANGHPKGTLIQDNDCPVKTGIRSYFAYLQGYDHVVIGNTAYDSLHEHILRVDGSDRVLVHDNHFENPYTDTNVQKGTLTIHEGSYIYVNGNTLKHGKVTVGPLGEGDGLSHPNDRTNFAVFENNDVSSPVIIEHGTNHIALRDNVVHISGGQAFEIEGWQGTYQRGVVDILLVHNTVIDTGDRGQFLKLGSKATDLCVMNNVFIAPNLNPGPFSAGAIYAKPTDMGSFKEVSNNVWPTSAGGSVNAIGGDYKTPVEWNAMSMVTNDQFKDLQLTDSNQISVGGIIAGANLKLAA